MTTPTREQVIEWAKEAGFSLHSFNAIDDDEVMAGEYVITDSLMKLAALAMSAGREQGLREAKEVCEREAEFLRSDQNGGTTACELCAAAIEQLRGK